MKRFWEGMWKSLVLTMFPVLTWVYGCFSYDVDIGLLLLGGLAVSIFSHLFIGHILEN